MTGAACAEPAADDVEAATRERIIEAAVDCVVDLGFARASLNAIAKQSSVSPGEIQDHFASREDLFLAVLDRATVDLRALLAERGIEGVTVHERLESFASIMTEFYGQPRYLALLQIQLNLVADPATSEQATQQLADMNRMAGPLMRSLIAQIFDGAVAPAPEIYQLLFFAVRGLAMSQAVNASLPPQAHTVQRPIDWESHRHFLVQGLDAIYKDLAVRGSARRR